MWDNISSVSSLSCTCIISLLRENIERVPGVPQKWYVSAKFLGLHSGKMPEGMGVFLGPTTAAGSSQICGIRSGKVPWNTVKSDHFC